mgnify:CR=1 FL=1
MKKKAVAVVMTAVMALGMVSAVSVQAGIEDKTLIVGFDAEYPPYGYMDENGEYTGFDLELAQAVCDLEGWELEKKPNQLGFQGYGTEFRIYRLYLEWIYYERKRR